MLFNKPDFAWCVKTRRFVRRDANTGVVILQFFDTVYPLPLALRPFTCSTLPFLHSHSCIILGPHLVDLKDFTWNSGGSECNNWDHFIFPKK